MYISSIIKLLKGKKRKFGKYPRENRYNVLKRSNNGPES